MMVSTLLSLLGLMIQRAIAAGGRELSATVQPGGLSGFPLVNCSRKRLLS